MNDVTTLNKDNFAEMSKLMGITDKPKSSTLPRLNIHHKPIMSTEEIKGKKVKVEAVAGGAYKLEIPNGPTYYAATALVRPFVQRYMFKRFVMGTGRTSNMFIKTIMSTDMYGDLKDNNGTMNCGKPSGWIEDFKALPQATRDLIIQTKRTRVLFGTIEMLNPVDATGNPVELEATPFIWEIHNRDAFKTLGGVLNSIASRRSLLPEHNIEIDTVEQALPNGDVFYLPKATLDKGNVLPLDEATQEHLTNFLDWIASYNEYIMELWLSSRGSSEEDVNLAEGFIEVDVAEVA